MIVEPVCGTMEGVTATASFGVFTEPAPSALYLLGRGVDLESERGVDCVGSLPAASDPTLVERARSAS